MTTTISQEQELISPFKGGSYGSGGDGTFHKIKDDISSKTLIRYRCSAHLPLINFILLIVLIVVVVSFGGIMYTSLQNSQDKHASSTKTALGHLGRNLILQQFSQEERIRSQGDSGLTNVRGHWDGDQVYDDNTYVNSAAAGIHDHSDFIRTFGMAEFGAVLNGVEFQTRHNDYLLMMPSTQSSEYNAAQDIPFPHVPPQVLNAGDIQSQIAEMQEWFRAFKTQNISHRDYTLYFKPILCYIEGTWIMDDNSLEEPYDSDRHEIDAATWKELHDKVRYMANSGRKDTAENLSTLPSSIRNLQDDTYPIISNWEFRILCHPLNDDLPLDRFRVVNDLSVQLMGSPLTRDELYYSRRARFDLAKYINLTDPSGVIYGESESYRNGYWHAGIKGWNYLDYLMEQIPGKDNYGGNLTDTLPPILSKQRQIETALNYNDNSVINSAYYNRYFSLDGADAMRRTKHRRGFNDRYLFCAQNTQEKVSPIAFEIETKDGNDGIGTEEISSRWSYAIPLEIIYLTPLTQWNPYNVPYIPRDEFVYHGGGSCVNNDAYPGWSDYASYFTPTEFYSSNPDAGSGDTVRSDICVLDENDESHAMFASGHYIIMPSIGGDVGFVRQRFPIFPIHGGASPAFNEIKTLQAIVLDDDYDDLSNGVPFFGNDRDRIYGFDVQLHGGAHVHKVYIPGWQVNMFWYDDINSQYYNGSYYMITMETDVANGHEHTIIGWRWRQNENSNTEWHYVINKCKFGLQSDDGEWMDNMCSDGHNNLIRGYV